MQLPSHKCKNDENNRAKCQPIDFLEKVCGLTILRRLSAMKDKLLI